MSSCKTPEQMREIERLEAEAHAPENVQYQHPVFEEALVGAGAEAEADAEVVDRSRKPAAVRASRARSGGTTLVPCGSGKKYKQCHGKLS